MWFNAMNNEKVMRFFFYNLFLSELKTEIFQFFTIVSPFYYKKAI